MQFLRVVTFDPPNDVMHMQMCVFVTCIYLHIMVLVYTCMYMYMYVVYTCTWVERCARKREITRYFVTFSCESRLIILCVSAPIDAPKAARNFVGVNRAE